MHPRLAGVGREAGAIMQQGLLIARAFLRGDAPTRVVGGPRVVIFVHGFMALGPVFGPMREAVVAATGLPTFDFSYGPLDSFEEVAARLAETIEHSVAKDTKVSLVGHSLGGLVARWYVCELGGAGRVDRIVTIATPHAGTRAARYAPAPIRGALAVGGAHLERLRQKASNGALLPLTAIIAEGDQLVVPIESAGDVPGAVVHRVPGVGHNESLFSPVVHALVVDALR
jgi:triacylglycerol lipase